MTFIAFIIFIYNLLRVIWTHLRIVCFHCLVYRTTHILYIAQSTMKISSSSKPNEQNRKEKSMLMISECCFLTYAYKWMYIRRIHLHAIPEGISICVNRFFIYFLCSSLIMCSMYIFLRKFTRKYSKTNSNRHFISSQFFIR